MCYLVLGDSATGGRDASATTSVPRLRPLTGARAVQPLLALCCARPCPIDARPVLVRAQLQQASTGLAE